MESYIEAVSAPFAIPIFQDMKTLYILFALTAASLVVASPGAAQTTPLNVFISVDMEGIGGIGTNLMTSSNGKDYGTGRQLMTEEVNTVVAAIFAAGPARILVNDSHGDMQNLIHTQLDSRVEYIQGNTKPLGMVQGLDGSFDAAIFIGYHARAGTEDGFLAHTGSGSVKGLWVNGSRRLPRRPCRTWTRHDPWRSLVP